MKREALHVYLNWGLTVSINCSMVQMRTHVRVCSSLGPGSFTQRKNIPTITSKSRQYWDKHLL